MTICYVPVTPGGTICDWLISETEDEAWEKLMIDASHMPYATKKAFQDRGYTIEVFNQMKGEE